MIIQVASIFKLNENKTFTDAEILEATNLLKTNFYFLKWDDLRLFVQQVKLGRYNDIYNRWDMPTFFQMLQRYCDERAEVSTSINKVKQLERNKEPLSPETIELRNEFLRKLDEKKRKTIEIKVPEIDEQQKLVNSWIAEFKKEVGILGGFIDYDGKKLSCEQYCRVKLKEYNENN